MSCPPPPGPARRPWRRIVTLALLPALAAACAPNVPKPAEEQPPFVFRSLDLRQRDPKGRPSWELRSPEARYDLARRVARARSPRGLIYEKGKPLYRIEATTGTVLNDGQVIQLEGKVSIHRLGRQPVLIQGERVRWIPSRELMEIDLRPSATDRDTRLVAQRARFLIARDRLELRGAPQLQRWTAVSRAKQARPAAAAAGPVDKAYATPPPAPPKRPPDVVIHATTADWSPGSGRLIARGPLRGIRTVKPGVIQTLTSPFLEGNTAQQELRLQAPVVFEDLTNRSRLEAQATLIDLDRQIVRTELPVRGHFGDLQVQGAALQADLDKQLATIPRDCALQQPGESLRARRCQWNWKTQAIEADGDVLLHRKANDQTTRSEKLRGRLGRKGLAVFTNPGSRVHTQLTVPKGSGSGKKREPEPIRL